MTELARMEMNCDMIAQERDTIALTVKSQVADALAPYLTDVTDDVTCRTTLEEVLVSRLIQIKKQLAELGIKI